MSEVSARNSFRDKVQKELPSAHWQRFEDRYCAGIPDCNVCVPGYQERWVEAKFLKSFPVRKTTPVKVGLRTEQVLWLNNRKRSGGVCIVLVRVGNAGWFSFDGHFDQLANGVTEDTFRQLAYWNGTVLDVRALLAILDH